MQADQTGSPIKVSEIILILENNFPAPNAYKLTPLMGKIFNSKYKSSQDKSMLEKLKTCDSRGNYPGPGSYLAFSEFGMYISKEEAEKRKRSSTMSTENMRTTAENAKVSEQM